MKGEINMSTRKEKIKKYWEDHKKEIIIGSAAFVGGAVITVLSGKCINGEKLRFANRICTFGVDPNTGRTMMQDINLAMLGSNHATVFWHGDDVNVVKAGEKLIDWYKDNGYNLDETKVTGLVAFIDK